MAGDKGLSQGDLGPWLLMLRVLGWGGQHVTCIELYAEPQHRSHSQRHLWSGGMQKSVFLLPLVTPQALSRVICLRLPARYYEMKDR